MWLKLANLFKNYDGGGETGEETDGKQLSFFSLNWADWEVGILSPSHEKWYHTFVEIQNLVSRHYKCDFSNWSKLGWHQGCLGKTIVGALPRNEATLSKELKCSWRKNRITRTIKRNTAESPQGAQQYPHMLMLNSECPSKSSNKGIAKPTMVFARVLNTDFYGWPQTSHLCQAARTSAPICMVHSLSSMPAASL